MPNNFNLYDATVQQVIVDRQDAMNSADRLRDWFLRHHPQEAQKLGHVSFDTWDRMARNRKRGYNEFLEIMGATFQRREATHARSRALPEAELAGDTHNVRWNAVMDWTKGQYRDSTSCFFTGNRVYLNGMMNQGTTYIGFHDMDQGIGTGRVFVSPTGPVREQGYLPEDRPNQPQGTPSGLLLWGAYGRLNDLGWMPVKPAVDVIQAITGLPHRYDLTDGISWLGWNAPNDEERTAISYLPNNYNSFRQEHEEPLAYDCYECGLNRPAQSARLVHREEPDFDEQAYTIARAEEARLNAELHALADDPKRYTKTGLQSVIWARRYQTLYDQAVAAVDHRRAIGAVEAVQTYRCMECVLNEVLHN